MTNGDKEGHPIHDLMEMVAGSKGGKGASLPITIILIGGVVLVLAIMGIQLALAKRKAAKLASKLRLEEEARATAKEEVARADSDAKKEAAKKEAAAADKRIQATSLELLDLQSKHQERLKTLSAVTSWDDITVSDKRS